MKNKIDTQGSSPSSPQEQAEPCLEDGEGLDVTAYSCACCEIVPTFWGNMTKWESREISWYGINGLFLVVFMLFLAVLNHGRKLRKMK